MMKFFSMLERYSWWSAIDC